MQNYGTLIRRFLFNLGTQYSLVVGKFLKLVLSDLNMISQNVRGQYGILKTARAFEHQLVLIDWLDDTSSSQPMNLITHRIS